MKKSDFIINTSLVPLDFIVLLLAGISAYYFRFSEYVSSIRPVFYEMPFNDYLIIIIKVSLIVIVFFAFSGFYNMKDKKLSRELPRIITGVSTVVLLLILAIFLKRELFSSRFIIILAWTLSIVYLFLIRVIVLSVRNYFFKKKKGLTNIIILGKEGAKDVILKTYINNPILGFKVIDTFNNLSELENKENLSKYFKDNNIRGIIQADSSIHKTEALDLLTFCQEHHITLKYVASLFQTQSLNFNLHSVSGLPMVEIQGTPLDGWKKILKRLFDIFVSLFLIIFLSPLLILISIIVMINSGSPVLVKLSRVGDKGNVFKMYKFRSMVKDAHKLKAEMMEQNERKDGPLFKMENDPRITKLGRFLRRTSLDELPQLFNVLKGQMSLVGPRPHEPEEVDKYQKGYKRLMSIKPGITGLAQVSGRSSLLFSEEAKLDIFYIENWSIFLDLIILLKTIKVLFKKDEAC